jgi:hypothetical protein
MKNQNFASVSSLANTYGETNDCVVKAVSLITEHPYERAHNHCRLNGRDSHEGCEAFKMLEEAGVKLALIFQKTRYNNCPYGKTVMNLSGFNRNKKYIAITSGHALAIINGKVEDWTATRQHRVLWIYECDTDNLSNSFLNTEESVIINKKKRKPRASQIRWELVYENTDEHGDIIETEVVASYKRKPTRVWRNIKHTFIKGREETLGKLCIRNLEDNTYHYG